MTRKKFRVRLAMLSVLLGGLSVLWPAGPAVALEARALVDRTTMTRDDVLSLTVVLSDGDAEVDTSNITDFEVGSRGRSSSVQIVNTHMTREIQYRFALAPLREGTLSIPALAVGKGRDQVRTEPIVVRVLAADDSARDPAPIAVEAEVSESSPYLGQSVVYTFRLSSAVQVLEPRFQAPSFEGFGVTPLEDQNTYRTVINGRQRTVTELQYLLTPQRAGKIDLEPARLSCQIAEANSAGRPRDPFGIFDDPFFRRTPVREKNLKTDPLTLEVRPLPPVPAGISFSGLVGRFAIAADLSPSSVATGESSTLTVTLEGQGNVVEAPSPNLPLPQSFKVYPEQPETQASHSAEGTRGRKVFRYALVPTQEGDFELGPVSLTAFDATAAQYVSLSSPPLELSVTPGNPQTSLLVAPPSVRPEEGAPSVKKAEIAQQGHDILDIYTGLDAIETRRSMGMTYLLVGLLVPPLLYLFVRWRMVRKGRVIGPSERMAASAREEVSLARRSAGSSTLAHLRRALMRAVLATAGREGEEMTHEEVLQTLTTVKVDETLVREVLALLSKIDSKRYSGVSGTAEADPILFSQVDSAVRSLLRMAK